MSERNHVLDWNHRWKSRNSPFTHWFQDDNEWPTTVNSDRYRAMLEDLMWKAVKSKDSWKGYFFMQDGVPPHCTNVALQFLKEKFRGLIISRNSEIYRAMLEDLMWEAVKSKASRKGYFFMQNGAPPTLHSSFWKEKFRGRVINRRSEIIWPAHSPDLNPLYFWFWGYVESQLISKNPRNINEMKVAVEGIVVSNIPQDMVRRTAANVIQRVSKCSEKRVS